MDRLLELLFFPREIEACWRLHRSKVHRRLAKLCNLVLDKHDPPDFGGVEIHQIRRALIEITPLKGIDLKAVELGPVERDLGASRTLNASRSVLAVE